MDDAARPAKAVPAAITALSAEGTLVNLYASELRFDSAADVYAAHFEGGRMTDIAKAELAPGSDTITFAERLDAGWKLYFLTPGTEEPLHEPVTLYEKLA